MTRRRRRRRSPTASSSAGRLRLRVPSASPRGFLLLACFVSVLGLCFSAAAARDCSRTHGEDGCRRCFDFRDACADRSSFCFPSTAPGLLVSEDGSGTKKPDWQASSGSELSRPLEFGMPGGGTVTCSPVDAMGAGRDGLGPGSKNDGGYNVVSCQALLVPDNWMRASTGMPLELEGASGNVDGSNLFSSSSMNVEISPSLLDWGTSGLYSASLAFLTVVNVNSDSALHVYEPISTDPQFYVYGYDDMVLGPGENASIAFVFLPRLLGSSSAHLVLQTNFGGFVIQAKGTAVESPYRIEPLVGLNIVEGRAMKRNLSIYNPFEDALSVQEVAIWMSSSEMKERSSHVACQSGAFDEAVDLASSSNDWYITDSSEFGRLRVHIRPCEQWEVQPWKSNTVVELNLQPLLEGKVFGAICMKLRNDTTGRMNTVVIPIELEVHGRTYYYSSRLVSVSFEHATSCDGSGLVFSLSLRNDASKLLRILSISEDNDNNPMIFEVKYVKGLILFPGSVTHIALIRYTSTVSEEVSFDNCNIVIKTNSSVGTSIKIPCQDLVRAAVSYTGSSVVAESDASYVGTLSQGERENSGNARTGSLGSILEDANDIEPTTLGAVETDNMILRSWRSHGTRTGISVLKNHELLFPVVQVGSQDSKWITVHNPSLHPAVMQLVLNSEETVGQCKAADDEYDHTFSSRSPEIDSAEARFGFSLRDSAITDAYVGPSDSASFGPVVFRPSNRCTWSSLALIRNNLSGVEWLPLRGHGGLQSVLLLEGSEPVWKIEFNVEHKVHNVPSLSQGAITCPSCSQQLSKEIHVKNTGDLPLQVKRVKVSGADCGVDGFTVDNCKGFGLSPSQSVRLLISYRADFSSAMVQRDLELAMTTGIFVIPMTANIPVCMLSHCRNSYFRSIRWKAPILVFGIVSLLVLVLVRIVPHSFVVGSEDYYMKIDSSSSKSCITKTEKPSFHHRNNKTTRLVREHSRPEGAFTDKHPAGVLDSPKRRDDSNNSDDQKKTASTSSAPPIASVEDPGSTPQGSGNLTIRVAREKGRRRKRKVGSAGLVAKFGVSSSHSGNSTPSSPLSPNASTPKRSWQFSTENASNPFSLSSEESKHRKKLDSGSDIEARAPPSESRHKSDWLPSPEEQPPATSPPPGNLLPSATALGVPSVTLLASSSPIAPHARAPGSNLTKDKAVKREDNAAPNKEFTYDIWGDHFSGHLLGKAKEVSSCRVFDASEGDSQSFFAREPQSLVTKPSSELPVSRGRRSPPSDVTSAYEIN